MHHRGSAWSGITLLCAVAALLAGASASASPPPAGARGLAAAPLAFVPNRGQVDGRIAYYAQGAGYRFAFTGRSALLSLVRGRRGTTLALDFRGANRAAPSPSGRLPGTVNYLVGDDPAGWRTRLPSFGRVVYRSLWPGVDLVFHGSRGTLKYELVIHPGARVGSARLAYRGARVALDPSGALLLRTPLGTLRDTRPSTYQLIEGRRIPVASRYVLGRSGAFGFVVGRYDRSRPLVVDPGLVYSTYLGGVADDEGLAIAIDPAGSAYVTGHTESADLPTTPGAFQPGFGGLADAFVAKLGPDGSLVYSTYLGGGGADEGRGIAVDGAGDAYVTGLTASSDFPTTPGALDTTVAGTDAFVTKLGPTGTAPLYSTYLGGGGTENGNAIALDASGSAYVTGLTDSADFPTTPLAFDPAYNGVRDAFVTKLAPTGTAPLVYSTYLGGASLDEGDGIAVDALGEAHVTGRTDSADFPTTPTSFDTTLGGSSDGFVTKLATAGSAPLLYSTYLGGSGTDDGRGIALDAVGDAHVTGATDSTDFPVTVGAFDMTANGGFDAYATKLDPAGSAPLVYSGYLGGSGLDLGEAIAIDPSGSAYVTGTTASTNFPTTPDALDSALDGQDAFVTKLAATGTAPLEHSTYLGGSGNDDGRGIAADPAANAYVTGVTDSTGFPTTPGAFDATFNGSADAFVTKLSTGPATPPGPGPPATLTLTPTVATNTVGATHCVTARVTDAAGTPLAGVTVRFAVPTASTTHASPSSGSAATDAAGQASFCFTASLPGEDAIHAFADANGNGGQDVGEPFGDATKTWTLPPTTKHCEVTIVDAGLIVTDLGDPATFGGLVSTDDDAEPWGHEEYADAGPHHTEHMRSKAILAVTCSADGTAATIVGSATVGGDGSALFRIDVTVAHSGAPATYGIVLSDGYASGTHRLQAGTIKILRDDD